MITLGPRIYGLGAILLGAVGILSGAFAPGWLPVPPDIPFYHALAEAAGLLLVLAGLAINLPRTTTIAALVLAIFFAASVLALHLPAAFAKPTIWVVWQAVAENTVMALGGVLALSLTQPFTHATNAGITRAACVMFGICLLVFGVSYFVYAKFTAAMTPAWLPPSQQFWTSITGLAQLAAGIAMLTTVKARLAAVLLTTMYASFSLLVHLPLILAAPNNPENWAENAINLILTGSAWTLAERLAAKPPRH